MNFKLICGSWIFKWKEKIFWKIKCKLQVKKWLCVRIHPWWVLISVIKRWFKPWAIGMLLKTDLLVSSVHSMGIGSLYELLIREVKLRLLGSASVKNVNWFKYIHIGFYKLWMQYATINDMISVMYIHWTIMNKRFSNIWANKI